MASEFSIEFQQKEILRELERDICHELCEIVHKEIYNDGDCPCTNQTTSCLAKLRVCDADKAISRIIKKRISDIEKQNDNFRAYAHDMGISIEQAKKELRVERKADDYISRQSLLDKAIYVELANGNKGWVIEKGYVEDLPGYFKNDKPIIHCRDCKWWREGWHIQ